MNNLYEKILIIGRFQPFHLGHLYLLRLAQEKGKKITIVLGSSNIVDENNPFDIFFREKMIKKVIENEEGLTSKIEKIVFLDDYYDDQEWFLNLKKKAGKFDLLLSNNQWTNNIFKKNNHPFLRIPFYKRFLYEGYLIRRLMKNNQNWEKRVPLYLISMIKKYQQKKQFFFNKNFSQVVLGGSFDHLHQGHKLLLKTALKYGKKIVVGITSDEMIKDKPFSQSLERYSKRKKEVLDFLKKIKTNQKIKIKKINDIFGKEDRNKSSQVIVFSSSTFKNVLRLNSQRLKNNLLPLFMIKIKDVLSFDKNLISSDRIRKGEIDRKGKSYWKILKDCFKDKKKPLIIQEKLKEKLRQPLGKIFFGKKEEVIFLGKKLVDYIKKYDPLVVVSVGDIVSYSLLKNQFIPSLQIFDYRSQKKDIEEKIKKILKNNFSFKIVNQTGSLSFEAFTTIKSAVENFLTKNKKERIFVEGEEDLLVLPAIIFLPLRSLIFYGHFQYGVVMIEVEEKIKKWAVDFLKKLK